jgi:uncharacterized protein (UPF0548 family)
MATAGVSLQPDIQGSGDPEEGEEGFVVSISPDETVLFEIVAFSRASDSLVRLSGPFGRGIQRVGTTGYLRALRRYVTRDGQARG